MSDLVVALTGASGSPYGVRLVEVLLRAGRSVHLTISPAAVEVFDREIGRALSLAEGEFDPLALLGPAAAGLDLSRLRYHHFRNFQAGIASGSFLTAGMVICPCSMGTLAAIARRVENLIHRAADVHLKERRKLVRAARNAAGVDPVAEHEPRPRRPGQWCCQRCRVLHAPADRGRHGGLRGWPASALFRRRTQPSRTAGGRSTFKRVVHTESALRIPSPRARPIFPRPRRRPASVTRRTAFHITRRVTSSTIPALFHWHAAADAGMSPAPTDYGFSPPRTEVCHAPQAHDRAWSCRIDCRFCRRPAPW